MITWFDRPLGDQIIGQFKVKARYEQLRISDIGERLVQEAMPMAPLWFREGEASAKTHKAFGWNARYLARGRLPPNRMSVGFTLRHAVSAFTKTVQKNDSSP